MTPTEARRRLPAELRQAMAARGVRQMDLAADMGVRPTTVSEWVRGDRFPAMARAPGLVEALDSPRLGELIRMAHTVTCIVCGRKTVHERVSRLPKYCGPAHKSTHNDRIKRAGREGVRAAQWLVDKRALALHQDAVSAHCRGCEPEGICRDDECALRPVSPLPFVAIRDLWRRSA